MVQKQFHPYCKEKYRSGYKENQYELKGIYRQRMDQFFVYNDKRNCERVYEKICEMMKLQLRENDVNSQDEQMNAREKSI